MQVGAGTRVRDGSCSDSGSVLGRHRKAFFPNGVCLLSLSVSLIKTVNEGYHGEYHCLFKKMKIKLTLLMKTKEGEQLNCLGFVYEIALFIFALPFNLILNSVFM